MSDRVIGVAGGRGSVAAERMQGEIARIREDLGVDPAFPPAVLEAAEKAAANPRLPELDRTDLPLVTIDPASSMDLDQAMCLEADGDGFVVRYAIADVAAFVTPGGVVDAEANRRGETLYGADAPVPLHPTVLSEGAGSLLPGQVRPVLLWTIRLDADGRRTDARVERALVKSRARFTYTAVQQDADAGSDELFGLLRQVGELRLEREAERGGIALPLPSQEIAIEDGQWRLEFRRMLSAERWNAQISLLTGYAAAEMMLAAGVGLLRTLPPPRQHHVDRLRHTAQGLGIEWPGDVEHPEFIRGLDPSDPSQAAMVVASTRLLRGSGYVGFQGNPPEQPLHAGLAAPYAHVTAPLRRLVDRYAGEICLSICADESVPSWVQEKLDVLPETMRQSGQRARGYENAIVNLVEAAIMAARVGENFQGTVVEVDHDDPGRGDITIPSLAIDAPIRSDGDLPLGEAVSAKLVKADVTTRQVQFQLA